MGFAYGFHRQIAARALEPWMPGRLALALPVAVAGCGWLCLALAGCGWLWLAVAGSGDSGWVCLAPLGPGSAWLGQPKPQRAVKHTRRETRTLEHPHLTIALSFNGDLLSPPAGGAADTLRMPGC